MNRLPVTDEAAGNPESGAGGRAWHNVDFNSRVLDALDIPTPISMIHQKLDLADRVWA
jgi:hypothetical protein